MNAKLEDLERVAELEKLTDDELRELIRRKHEEREERCMSEADMYSCPDRLFH